MSTVPKLPSLTEKPGSASSITSLSSSQSLIKKRKTSISVEKGAPMRRETRKRTNSRSELTKLEGYGSDQFEQDEQVDSSSDYDSTHEVSSVEHEDSVQLSLTEGTFITSTHVSDEIPQQQNHDSVSYENSEARRQIENALEEHQRAQDIIRSQLAEFLDDMKGKKDEEGQPLVEFPEAYDSIIDYLKHQRNVGEISNDVIRQFIDASAVSEQEAMNDIQEGDDIETGLNRIRKLDLLLHHNEEKFRDVSKRVKQIIKNDKRNARLRGDKKVSLRNFILQRQRFGGDESFDMENTDPNQVSSPSRRLHDTSTDDAATPEDLPFPGDDIFLTKAQQDRIAQLLDDNNIDMGVVPPGEGFEPTADELERMNDIDAKLRAIAPSLFEAQEDFAELDDFTGDVDESHSDPDLAEKDDDEPYMDDSRKKISDIDEKIARLYADSDRTAPRLSDEQIQNLLRDIPDAEKLLQ